MSSSQPTVTSLPGGHLDTEKMPGHWLLAKLGKRVLRPGGLETTEALLSALDIGLSDDIIEFAPGLGGTARMMLARNPRSYVGVERDQEAVDFARHQFSDFKVIDIRAGPADATGLESGRASVVIGEAMLTMNTEAHKKQIIAEAFRLLRPAGRYGIHELKITSDDLSSDKHAEIDKALSAQIHVGARPLPSSGWRNLLEEAGFVVEAEGEAPMHLLHPRRMIADEGFMRTLGIAGNLLRDGAARKRVLGMRHVFNAYREHLAATYLVARKPAT
ncbi:MAG: methyltransferase domain-containing protein [Pseudomonadota bacterium]